MRAALHSTFMTMVTPLHAIRSNVADSYVFTVQPLLVPTTSAQG